MSEGLPAEPRGAGEVVLYATEDGQAQVFLRAEGGTVRLPMELNPGCYTFVGLGSDGVRDIDVTVTDAKLVSITISPDPIALAVGQTLQLGALDRKSVV